jgi:Mn-dependent DtxR family transcriptional regulator
MHRNTKKEILGTIQAYGRVDTYILLDEFKRKSYTDAFDNTVMRYVRRLAEKGLLKRTARGSYKLTARGRRFIEKTI